jgi:hypothetical protein
MSNSSNPSMKLENDHTTASPIIAANDNSNSNNTANSNQKPSRRSIPKLKNPPPQQQSEAADQMEDGSSATSSITNTSTMTNPSSSNNNNRDIQHNNPHHNRPSHHSAHHSNHPHTNRNSNYHGHHYNPNHHNQRNFNQHQQPQQQYVPVQHQPQQHHVPVNPANPAASIAMSIDESSDAVTQSVDRVYSQHELERKRGADEAEYKIRDIPSAVAALKHFYQDSLNQFNSIMERFAKLLTKICKDSSFEKYRIIDTTISINQKLMIDVVGGISILSYLGFVIRQDKTNARNHIFHLPKTQAEGPRLIFLQQQLRLFQSSRVECPNLFSIWLLDIVNSKETISEAHNRDYWSTEQQLQLEAGLRDSTIAKNNPNRFQLISSQHLLGNKLPEQCEARFLEVEERNKLRAQTAHFLQLMGQHCKITQLAIATASVYLHVFFSRFSFHCYDRFEVAACCLFLAGKVEERRTRVDQVIEAYFYVKHKYLSNNERNYKQPSEAIYEEMRQKLYSLEFELLDAINYSFELKHPYSNLLSYIKDKIYGPSYANASAQFIHDETNERGGLAQIAWLFINDR